jgi:hypothetical protein
MKVTKSLPGQGPTHYFVEGSEDWYAVCQWMQENDIDYLQESCASSPGQRMRIGFSVGKNVEWFALKWL